MPHSLRLHYLAFAAVVALSTVAAVAQAQPVEAAAVPMAVLPGPSVACPHPHNVTLTPSGAPTPDLREFPANSNVGGSVWNQTVFNKHFGHTFRFEQPKGDCCQYSPGVLTVTYKALDGGGVGSSSSSNDGGGAVHKGLSVPGAYGYIFGNAPVATGTVVTKTYTIPAGIMASGKVSLYAQDDTAVVSATLRISGCCVTPTRPE